MVTNKQVRTFSIENELLGELDSLPRRGKSLYFNRALELRKKVRETDELDWLARGVSITNMENFDYEIKLLVRFKGGYELKIFRRNNSYSIPCKWEQARDYISFLPERK